MILKLPWASQVQNAGVINDEKQQTFLVLFIVYFNRLVVR